MMCVACDEVFMDTFFHTQDGHLRGLRVAACFFVFNVLVSLVGDGWHSLSWIAWFLMAFGFFAVSSVVEVPQPGRSKWHSPGGLVGLAAVALGVSLLVYRVVGHWRTP